MTGQNLMSKKVPKKPFKPNNAENNEKKEAVKREPLFVPP